METEFKNKSILSSFLIKLGIILGLVIAVFLFWGLTSKVEAASNEFKINGGWAHDNEDQEDASVAVKGSKFMVGWSGYGAFDDNTDVFYQLVNSDGTLPGGGYNNQRVDVDELLEDQTRPSLVSLASEEILMVWHDERYQGQSRVDIFARLFTVDANGDPTFESGPIGNSNMDFRINDDISNFECDTPWVTTDGTNFTIAYYNKENAAVKVGGDDGTRIKLAFVNQDAFPKDKKTAIAGDYQSSYDAEETAVIENPTSKKTWKKAVAWIGDNEHVYIQRYKSDGSKHGGVKDFDEQFLVSRINLTVNNQGHLAVAWSRGNSLPNVDAHYAIYDGSWGEVKEIEPDPNGLISNPRVIANGKIFYAVYAQAGKSGHPYKYGDLHIRRITKNSSSHGEDKLDAKWVSEWSSPAEAQFSLLVLPKTGNETFRLGVQYSAKKDTSDYKQIWGLQAKVTFSEQFDQITVSDSKVKALTDTGTYGYLSPKAVSVAPGRIMRND